VSCEPRNLNVELPLSSQETVTALGRSADDKHKLGPDVDDVDKIGDADERGMQPPPPSTLCEDKFAFNKHPYTHVHTHTHTYTHTHTHTHT
jgi:hypothetical protein